MEVRTEKEFCQKLLSKDDSTFKEYTENTTAHGVVRIFKEDYNIIRRLFWLIVFLAAATTCLNNCVNRILFLASSPTSTTITTHRVRPTVFPAVTVCNLNYLTASGLERHSLQQLAKKVFNIDRFQLGGLSDCEANINDSVIAKSVLLDDLSKTATQPLHELIKKCLFLGKPCNLANDFMFSPLGIGTCYTFNGYSRIPSLVTNGTGEQQGLFLILNINQSQYTTSPQFDAGVRVYVHQNSEPAQVLDQGISIPPGKVAFVGIHQENIKDKTEKSCILEYDNAGFNFLGKVYNYSASACHADCQLTALADTCGCIYAGQDIAPSNPVYANMRKCSFDDMCCIRNVTASAIDCDCISACSSTDYESSVSYTSIPADYSRDVFRPLFGDNTNIDENIVGLSLYFQTLNVRTETSTFSYSVVALLSDIGGQLGLFLGISVISILEFCIWLWDESVYRLCCFSISWRKSENKSKEQLCTEQNGGNS